MIKIASIFGVLLCSSAAYAQTGCRTIQDTAAALSCLDKSATPKAAKPKAAKPKSAKPKAAKLAVDQMTHVKDAVLKTLKDPQSAVFADMTRADRLNARGEPMDTVCGTVNAKNSDGNYNGPKKFVYFIGGQPSICFRRRPRSRTRHHPRQQFLQIEKATEPNGNAPCGHA
jgi:hypothetical protein